MLYRKDNGHKCLVRSTLFIAESERACACTIIVTKSDKANLITLSCIQKYRFETLNALYFSGGAVQSCQIYCVNSVVIELLFHSYFYKLLECCWFFG